MSSYVLNQFNQPPVEPSDISSATNLIYMKILDNGTPRRKKKATDSGITTSTSSTFYDECIQFSTPLASENNYYLHAKIKRLSSEQTFYVYLINYEDETGVQTQKTQYLKTITVQEGLETDWVDFEIIFSPIIDFDTVLFQLQRTVQDYRDETRYPVIVYEELSKLNNVIEKKIKSGAALNKMGIQSRPGLVTCINGEEIHVGRSGLYEFRNGIISVTFFSVARAAEENPDGSNPLLHPQTREKCTLQEYLAYLASLPTETSFKSTNSKCIFSNSKLRQIEPFTLDCMYKED